MVTVGEFFQQKLSNFVQYCHTNLTDPKFNQFHKYIDNIKGVLVEDAIGYFLLVKQTSSVDQHLSQVAKEVNLTTKDFTTDQYQKLQQYISCFIDIVSSVKKI